VFKGAGPICSNAPFIELENQFVELGINLAAAGETVISRPSQTIR
jgi:hypothetical protein